MTHVVVIGGGFAGLATGVDLAARDVQVTVIEGRPHLGGRAYSFVDEASGEVVDNGQHAMMGCYSHTLAFLDRIGASHKVMRQSNLRVDMVHRSLGAGTITAAALPGPLHMVCGLARYQLLTRAERARVVVAGLRMMWMHRRADPRLSAWTVAQLLVLLGQSENARANFWYPVAVATLNEWPDRAAAAPFIEVLARAFFGGREESQFVFSRVGLSDLYTGDARQFIEARGGRVELRAGVADLEFAGGRFVAAQLRDGRRIAADACVSSVPPKALAAMLPGSMRAWPAFARLEAFTTAPIVSTHLWMDRPVLDADFVGFVGTTTQFVFNRSRLSAATAGDGSGPQYLSAVISAGHEVAEWSTERIIETVVSDIRALLPRAAAARVVRAVVVKEKHATISVTPQAEAMRPPVGTPVPNFFLAGDWTGTGLPPTIESAVLSGQLAATRVLDTVGAG